MTISHHTKAIALRQRPITANERAWVEFLRLASHDRNPAPTLKTVQALRKVFSEAGEFKRPT